MIKYEVREPKQKRSKEKKQKIIEASYKLFREKGYYKTNTMEIAEEAGVSTGIVYSYFQDKKDILFEVIRLYISLLTEQFQPLLSVPVSMDDVPFMIEKFIDISVASHATNVDAHDEFLALSLLEKDITLLFNDFEDSILSKVSTVLVAAGVSQVNLLEKMRIGYGIVEQVCHDYIRQKYTREEFQTTKSLAVQIIVMLLNENGHE